jgi:hypothetical protein
LSAPSTVTSGTGATVTLQAKDAAGHPLSTGGASVVFSVSAGSGTASVGTSTDHANGTYTAALTGILSGTVTVTAALNGTLVTSTALVVVAPGAASASTSTVSAPATVAPGVGAQVTFQAKDAAGNLVRTGGASVVLSALAGTGTAFMGSTSDTGNGTYTAVLTGVVAGTVTARATLEGTAVTSTAPVTVSPSAPALGAHASNYQMIGTSSASSISLPALNTAPSGSTLLVGVGRGSNASRPLPTDNKGNTSSVLGSTHAYSLWAGSGTTLYAFQPMTGGAGQVVTVGIAATGDEVSVLGVEIRNGGVIRQHTWTEVAAGNPLTTLDVTTTGPALLVAFWWGDYGGESPMTVAVDSGFTVLDSIVATGNGLVEGAVAVRATSAAGTYHVTWSATPLMGAQLYLVAVEAGP